MGYVKIPKSPVRFGPPAANQRLPCGSAYWDRRVRVFEPRAVLRDFIYIRSSDRTDSRKAYAIVSLLVAHNKKQIFVVHLIYTSFYKYKKTTPPLRRHPSTEGNNNKRPKSEKIPLWGGVATRERVDGVVKIKKEK